MKLLFTLTKWFMPAAVSMIALSSCDSSTVKDAIDLADGVDRKQIEYSKLGVNAFANDFRFGGPSHQFDEVRSTLRIKRVRILMNWDDAVQASPQQEPNLAPYPLTSRFSQLLLHSLPGWEIRQTG
jgi:hypothetical protein